MAISVSDTKRCSFFFKRESLMTEAAEAKKGSFSQSTSTLPSIGTRRTSQVSAGLSMAQSPSKDNGNRRPSQQTAKEVQTAGGRPRARTSTEDGLAAGQSRSCPNLEINLPALPHANMSRSGSKSRPSLLLASVEQQLIQNAALQRQINTMGEKLVKKKEKPKGNMIQRMLEVERNMKSNQIEIDDRREVLDFFDVNKQMAKERKAKSNAVAQSQRQLASNCSTPLHPASTMRHNKAALEARIAMLTNPRKTFADEFFRRSEDPGAPDESMLWQHSFPPEASVSMGEKLRAYELQAMYNAKTLYSQRQFLDSYGTMARDAAQRLAANKQRERASSEDS